MKTSLLALLVTIISVSTLAHAVDRLPVQTILCYPATHIVNWSYRVSGNTHNGALDHEGYIYLNFNRYEQADGHVIQSNLTHPMPELSWDADFKHLTAATSSDSVTCASVGHFGGIHKDERHCRLEGRIIPNGPLPSECGDQLSYLFDGELIVNH